MDKCTEVSGGYVYSYRTDYYGNAPADLAQITNNAVYITGSILVGNSKCGEPDLAGHGVLMKFNLTNKNPDWIKTFPDQELGYFFISPSQKLFVIAGMNSIRVFNLNGNPGTLLTFSDEIASEWYSIRNKMRLVNREDGFIYLLKYVHDTGEHYFAKYSIPALEFANSSHTSYVEEPLGFTLYQNYPEPFNPTTTIRFNLPEQSMVSLKVYNVVGQEVATLLDKQIIEEGEHEIEFYAQNLASGIFFYRMIANGIKDEEENTSGNKFTSVRKMLLVR